MKKIIKFLKLICSPAKDGMHHEDYTCATGGDSVTMVNTRSPYTATSCPSGTWYTCNACGRKFDSLKGIRIHQARWCKKS